MSCASMAHLFEDHIEAKQIKIDDLPDDFTQKSRLLNLGKDMCYYSPATGGYGIVRVVLMVPETQALFVCPMGCARHGVIASYYYKETRDRANAFFISEDQLVLGNHVDEAYKAGKELLEDTHAKGISFIYTCADDLLGSDFDSIAHELEAHTQTPARVATMNPIRVETDRPPLVRAFETVYSYLDKAYPQTPESTDFSLINLMGVYSNLDQESEIHALLKTHGYVLKHVTDYTSFDAFQNLRNSKLNLIMGDAATKAALHMRDTFEISNLRFPLSLESSQIEENYQKLSQALDISLDYEAVKQKELKHIDDLLASNPLKNKRVVIGNSHAYTPLELAALLTKWGARVEEVYTTSISRSDEVYLAWLKEHAPYIHIIPPEARTACSLHERHLQADLALGLDASYYADTQEYVDLSFENPLFGFVGQRKLLERVLNPLRRDKSFEELLSSSSLVV